MYAIESEASCARPDEGDLRDGATDGADRHPFAPRTAVRPPADPKEGRHPACRGRGDEPAAGESVREDLFNWF